MRDIKVYHDSHNLYYRNPFGAVLCGSKIFIRIDVGDCDEVKLELIYFNGDKEAITMKKNEDQNYDVGEEIDDYQSYEVEFEVNSIGIVNYFFSIRYGNSVIYYGNNKLGLGGIGEIYYDDPRLFQITVYEEYEVPDWYKEGIMYQIFPDSFYREEDDFKTLFGRKDSFIYSNWYDEPMYIRDKQENVLRWAFYGGNLKGITLKLPYLKSLGVSIIYLNPIFEASSVHRYNTGDYLKIDSILGEDEDFKNLCEAAKGFGINVILDGVFSHTGDDSIYFNKYNNYENLGAFQGSQSPYHKWYRFKKYPEEYECWWGVKSLPNVNELDPSYMDFVLYSNNSVVSKWMGLGASGWRLDVADELPDEFIEAFNRKVKEIRKDAVVLGEVWEDASNKISYENRRKYLLGRELDSVMNYPFRSTVIDFFTGKIGSKEFEDNMMSLYENYPREAFYSNMNMLGSHDTKRIFTIINNYVNNEDVALSLLKLCSLLQMTFPGVPCIYYGDEAGLEGMEDPYNRKAFPWGREKAEILSWYHLITSLRNEKEVFKRGGFKFLKLHRELISFERSFKDKKALILLNRSITDTIKVEISLDGEVRRVSDMLNENCETLIENGKLLTEVKPLEGRVFNLQVDVKIK